jgi:hypothetical protein
VGEALRAESCIALGCSAPGPFTAERCSGSHKPRCLDDNPELNLWICSDTHIIECCHSLEHACANQSVHAFDRIETPLRPPLVNRALKIKQGTEDLLTDTLLFGSPFPCGLSTIATRATARLLPGMHWLGTDISSTILHGSSFARLL